MATTGVPGVFLVCREGEEDEHGAAAHSGSLSSEAPALAQHALGRLELSYFQPQSMSVGFSPAQALPISEITN